MGTKKAKKGLEAPSLRELEKKEKVKKAKTEIDDIFGKKEAPVQQEKEKEEKVKKEKAKSEIDDIFGQKKRKKQVEGEEEQKKEELSEVVKLNSKGELVKPKKPKVPKSTPAAAAGGPTSRKKTEDGFTVYTAEELGFNKKNAGGTKLCPFDCDCCF